tara:strand:- start:225 stop:1148 length:924 start_codon:yes stop_codon:yes gene_type:complete
LNNAKIPENERLTDKIQRIGHMSTQRTWWQLLDVKQRLKLVVYPLLLINFAHYIGNDIEQAQHTFHSGWRWYDWTSNFATTLDELGWFLLLFLLELETYVLSDDAFTRRRIVAMTAIRLICYLAIGHAVFAFGEYLVDLSEATHHVDAALCAFASDSLSFTRNLEYWELDASNCGTLSAGSEFYIFSQGQVISDAAGMTIELELAWIDLVEIVVWLFILFCIELRIRLQDRGISSSRLLSFATTTKGVLYGILWCLAAYWAYRGHWIFAWDEALWILGFMAIGMNLSDWRKEIAQSTTPKGETSSTN